MLKGESLQADAGQLLQDIPVLQDWQRARNPGHKIRDAMLKLGTLWDVPRNVEGKKRPPAEVAQEIEENMLKKAEKILIGSAATPATRVTEIQQRLHRRALLWRCWRAQTLLATSQQRASLRVLSDVSVHERAVEI